VLPVALLQSLKGIKGFDEKSFREVHTSGEQVTSVRINPSKQPILSANFDFKQPSVDGSSPTVILSSRIPWTQYGYYLATRPSFTFDPLFHAGCYYVQEASSMFLEQALKQSVDLSQPLKVLDLCASPGGKSTHLQSLISKDSLLVSNDVIRSRANVLKDNIVKWGCSNIVVTNNDPKDFERLGNYFDVIVVDAPCSGSGLFRRDPDAINEWSENNVQLCSQRQQRILADVWPVLKKDGILIYSTCSFSKEEDEDIVNWLLNEFPAGKLVYSPLLTDSNWGTVATDSGYRFWPDKVRGEGFFIACLKKTDGITTPVFKIRNKPAAVDKKDIAIVEKWVDKEGKRFIRHLDTVYAWPEHLADDFSILLDKLRVIYSGTVIGELMRDKLVPDHALAMSPVVHEQINKIALNAGQAIQYLQRKELRLETAEKGWQLVTYEGYPLGWVNVLPNRVNNYYPKEMRILKDY
jgi:16S rRNA C967 or C1407 C5-methylase (RsmB/RsmF family)/NOL1/NOP2/fmu family ribosome biogenesis protein